MSRSHPGVGVAGPSPEGARQAADGAEHAGLPGQRQAGAESAGRRLRMPLRLLSAALLSAPLAPACTPEVPEWSPQVPAFTTPTPAAEVVEPEPVWIPERAPPSYGPPTPEPYRLPPLERPSSALPEDRDRRLLDEARFLQGRLQTLDRTLESYDRDRLRGPPLDDPTSRLPGARTEPLAERQELERRMLRDRLEQIERDLRR